MTAFYFWQSKLSYFKQRIILSLPIYVQINKNIKEHLHNIRSKEFNIKIPSIRNWVNRNSIHLIDLEHDLYAFKIEIVLSKLWEKHKHNALPPHLSCGPRAYAMKEILHLLEIPSRIIDIFQISKNKVNSHTLLEVYNKENNKWVLQDPDFNVEYRLKNKGTMPQSAISILKSKIDNLSYNTNDYIIENKTNCINTITECFHTAILYRLSYDGKKSFALINNFETLNLTIIDDGKSMTFKQYLIIRGFNPKISLA